MPDGELQLEILRELAPGEPLPEPPKRNALAPLQQLRMAHHFLAQLIAEERPTSEVSMLTGYSSAAISQYQRDPAFQELLAYYRTQEASRNFDVKQRLTAAGLDAVQVLYERMEAGNLSNRETLEFAELCLDRSGAVPLPGRSAAGLGGGAPPVALKICFAPEPGTATIDITPQPAEPA